MFDSHMHCSHSVDSPTEIDIMIETAIAKGVKYVAFTDHLDRDYLYGNSKVKNIRQLDIPFHIQDVSRAKAKYAGVIDVACGVECAFSVEAEDDYVRLLEGCDFDVILNSVHSINGVDCYLSDFFDGKSKQQAYTDYLLAVLASVNAKYDFDVITHLGYVCRKAPFENKDMQLDDFADIIDSILKTIISRDKSLELNTNNSGTSTPFLPYLEIAERYIRLGGSNFTFGSDAHRVDRVNDKFDVVKDFLLSHNQKYLNVYKCRQKIKVDLSKL